MIPLRDYNPSRRRSLITWGLILINVAIYFYLAQNPVMSENAIARYALVPADITAGRHLGTLITSMFLHASLLHVGGNMLFLWIFGNNVEDKLGEIKFVILYFAAGIAGSPGTVEVLVNTGSNLIQQALQPGLSVKVTRKVKKVGKKTIVSRFVQALDDGFGVPTAVFKIGGRTIHANSAGTASVPAGTGKASAAGYVGASFHVR